MYTLAVPVCSSPQRRWIQLHLLLGADGIGDHHLSGWRKHGETRLWTLPQHRNIQGKSRVHPQIIQWSNSPKNYTSVEHVFWIIYKKRGPWTVWASVYSVQIYKPLSISVRQSKLTASGQCLLVRISRTAVIVYMSESCSYMVSHNVENYINNHNFIMNWTCSYLLFECRTTEYYMEYIDMQTLMGSFSEHASDSTSVCSYTDKPSGGRWRASISSHRKKPAALFESVGWYWITVVLNYILLGRIGARFI